MPSSVTSRYTITRIEKEEVDTEKLKRLILESNRWGIHLDRSALEYDASLWVTSLMEKITRDPMNPSLFGRITYVLELLEPLSLNLNLWKAQNMYFNLKEHLKGEMDKKAEKGDGSAKEWLNVFNKLAETLRMKVG